MESEHELFPTKPESSLPPKRGSPEAIRHMIKYRTIGQWLINRAGGALCAHMRFVCSRHDKLGR